MLSSGPYLLWLLEGVGGSDLECFWKSEYNPCHVVEVQPVTAPDLLLTLLIKMPNQLFSFLVNHSYMACKSPLLLASITVGSNANTNATTNTCS